LKVDPKENPFNPEESVDFAGIQGRLFNIPMLEFNQLFVKQILIFRIRNDSLHPKEKELLKQLELFPEVIQNAAQNHSPALLANFVYDLVREYNFIKRYLF
jgi:arginyl-tRNA synthetase